MANTVVSAQELRAHLGDPRWVAIDARYALGDANFGLQSYRESHIPGAFYADLGRDLSGAKTGTNGRHPFPDPATFAAFLASLGVDDDTQIVAYDAGGGDMFAARLWFRPVDRARCCRRTRRRFRNVATTRLTDQRRHACNSAARIDTRIAANRAHRRRGIRPEPPGF